MALIPRTKLPKPPKARVTHYVNAVCVGIEELGVHDAWYGSKERLLFKFKTDEREPTGEPLVLTRVYNSDLHKWSSLRRDVETWLGHKLNRDELAEFSVWDLEDAPCRIKIAPAADSVRNRLWDIEKIKPPLKKRVKAQPAPATSN